MPFSRKESGEKILKKKSKKCSLPVTFPLGSLPFLLAWGSTGAMNPRCCLLPQTERCFGKKPFCSFVFFSGAYLRALTHWPMDTFKAKCKALFSVRDYFSYLCFCVLKL
ncbi:phospholipase D alpha 1-like isoform X1 [Gossypium australe]|uniref:Phospholipase D alpha 1-like isoform X1 n=1 Tax=Gossypium australe TaxID=47621 RepID=A0A5B6X6Z3_9ROSI|nr:phospholipase D alpha 1-like isoform X1 [Gossypium australe]